MGESKRPPNVRSMLGFHPPGHARGGGDDVKERKGNVHGRATGRGLSQPVSSPSSRADATFWGAARTYTSLPCQPVRLPTVPAAGAV